MFVSDNIRRGWQRVNLLDGTALAQRLEAELAGHVAALTARRGGQAPRLATVLVGENPASATYVRMKQNACERVGMESVQVHMPAETSTAELVGRLEALNDDDTVDGILLQHPVPSQIDERPCFDTIALEKDVDGVTCLGFGRMAMGEPAYGSATPAGIMRLLAHYQIPLRGKRAVVVGRSPILGKPMALMLLNEHATVTICHSRTLELSEVVGEAEVIVGAVGKPEFLKADWIRPGAVVIDAGYHPGRIGDIELSAGVEKYAAFTPVPGGVGPMTIATLLAQTVAAAQTRSA